MMDIRFELTSFYYIYLRSVFVLLNEKVMLLRDDLLHPTFLTLALFTLSESYDLRYWDK